MKRICSFLLLIAFYTSNAQPGEKITYYYQGRKIAFPVNNNRIIVQLAAGETTGRRMAQLSTILRITGTDIKSMANVKRISAALPAGNNSVRINELKRQGFVEFVHPCFTSPYGKDMGYGDELVLKLKPGTTQNAFNNVVQQLQASIVKKYPFASDVFIVSAGKANGYDALAVANRFFETGLFVYAEPDLTLFDGLSDPNDPLFNYQWSHNNSGSAIQYNGAPGTDMKVQQAWNFSTGAGIKVAVIDEGVDIEHPDLKPNLLQGFDCTSGTANTGDGKPLSPVRGHGTSCTGIIAALANNNLGVAGVAPDCRVIPINLSAADGSFASYARIAEGFDYAWQNGADVISNSWGGGSPSGIIEDAISRAVTQGRNGKGSVVLFASGNENGAVYYPAILPGVIAVGGVNMCGQRKTPVSCDGEGWWGANYGIGLDIAAPCVKILTTDITGNGGYNPGDYNYVFNGTSAATPGAAAVAALILGANNNLTVTQVRNIIESTCDKLPSYNYTLDANQPNGTWNPETGHGLVNAFRAVQAALTANACNVQIKAAGPVRFCAGGSVNLSIVNPAAGNFYQWRKDGTNVGTGNTITASISGSYDVVATATGGCVATAAPVMVTNLANTVPLTASAGTDKFICAGQSVKLGGNAVAAGGSPWLPQKQVFGMDRRSNSFIKFSIKNPLQFDTIAAHVVSDAVLASNGFFTGGDFTPYGYYVIAPETNDLVKIDTANGIQQPIGKAITETGFYWMGLSWDPESKNLYGAATGAGGSKLYIIDPFTANITPVASIAIDGLLWLAVRNNGDMYAMSSDQYIYKIDKLSGIATRLPNATGFSPGFEQDADFDPITDSLYLTAKIYSPQSAGDFRIVNTTTGLSAVIGPMGDGLAQVDATGIAGPGYQYSWSPATGLSSTTVSVPAAAPQTTTLYTLNVADMCGNTATSQVTVHVSTEKPVIAITAQKDSICIGETVRLSATQHFGYTYQWYYEGSPITGAADSFYLAKEGGVYTVTAVMNVCSNTSLPFTIKSCEIRLNAGNALSACTGKFYDSGGRLSNYSANESFTRTITAASPGSVLRVTFSSFNTEAGQDILTIYDGPGIASPVLAVLSGSPALPLSYTASSGALTFSFKSNGSMSMQGWEALFSCYTPAVYRSKTSGSLADPNTWEIKSGNGFINASDRPHLYDDSIIIQQGHTITHTDVAKLDQLWIQRGGVLRIIQSGFLDLADGPGNDLQADGLLEIRDAGSIDGNGTLVLKGDLSNAVHLKNISVRTEVTGSATQTIETTGSISALYVTNPSVIFNTGNDVSIDTLILDMGNGMLRINGSQPALVTVNHKLLLLHGRLVMGNNAILNLARESVTEGAGASSFVEGPVRRNTSEMGVVSMDFPIGKDVYRPVKLGVYISSGGASAYQAEVFNTAPVNRSLPVTIKGVSAKRFYRISNPVAQPVSSSIVILSYGPDDGVTDAASLRMVKNDGAAGWIDLGGTGSGNGSGTIISNVNFTSFGDFALANAAGGTNVLPVQWLQVNARQQNKQVLVTWKISNELNVKNYVVERSADGISFNEIAWVDASTSTAIEKMYEASDLLPMKGTNYYRIKQTDKDGRYDYSKILQLTIRDASGFTLLPNPATETITVQNSQSMQLLQCFNSNGQLVYQAKPMSVRHVIPVLQWAAGIYHVKMISGAQVTTARFVKN